MKKYSIYLLPIAALTFIGSLAITGAVLLVTVLTASHIGDDLPMNYLERLSLPTLSIIVPVIGMLFFASILPSLFSRRIATEAKIVELQTSARKQPVKHLPVKHLKAA